MYALDSAKKQAMMSLKKALGKTFIVTPDMLGTPPKPEYGDLSFPCFALGKGMGRNPMEIATELAAKMAPGGLIKSITSAGPFVNFTLDDDALAQEIESNVRAGKRYGTHKTGEGKRVLVEYANPNTHKEVHIGHLRNFSYGLAIVRLLRANGFAVTPVSYINDLGNNVAKCLWGLKHLYPGVVPPKEERLNFLGRVYAEATAAIADDDVKKAEVSEIQRNLEDMKGDMVPLWKETHAWSMENLKATFSELGLELEKIYLEHELIADAHEIVKKLLTEGLAKISEGAVIIDLEADGAAINLLRKTDGTLLYNAKDLALAFRKERDYSADRSLYVIDKRQSLAMKQLAVTLKKMGYDREITHLSYDFVTLPEGAMSSRKGNIIRWTDFRDDMVAAFAAETAKRHPTWRAKKVQAHAHSLTISALFFVMLRQDPEKIITFDMQEAMAFEGFTGPYLLYAIARIKTLAKKTRLKPRMTSGKLTHPREKQLLRTIMRYPEVVHRAGADLKPSAIAQYAFALAQETAGYYEDVRVLEDEDSERQASRLALLAAIRVTLEQSVTLLGMTVLDEM